MGLGRGSEAHNFSRVFLRFRLFLGGEKRINRFSVVTHIGNANLYSFTSPTSRTFVDPMNPYMGFTGLYQPC